MVTTDYNRSHAFYFSLQKFPDFSELFLVFFPIFQTITIVGHNLSFKNSVEVVKHKIYTCPPPWPSFPWPIFTGACLVVDPRVEHQPIIQSIFPENCFNMKKLDREGARPEFVYVDPPLIPSPHQSLIIKITVIYANFNWDFRWNKGLYFRPFSFPILNPLT